MKRNYEILKANRIEAEVREKEVKNRKNYNSGAKKREENYNDLYFEKKKKNKG